MFYLIFRDVFQFHKGTIRTTRLSDMKLSQNNFNSIKVQLEQNAQNIINNS